MYVILGPTVQKEACTEIVEGKHPHVQAVATRSLGVICSHWNDGQMTIEDPLQADDLFYYSLYTYDTKHDYVCKNINRDRGLVLMEMRVRSTARAHETSFIEKIKKYLFIGTDILLKIRRK